MLKSVYGIVLNLSLTSNNYTRIILQMLHINVAIYSMIGTENEVSSIYSSFTGALKKSSVTIQSMEKILYSVFKWCYIKNQIIIYFELTIIHEMHSIIDRNTQKNSSTGLYKIIRVFSLLFMLIKLCFEKCYVLRIFHII